MEFDTSWAALFNPGEANNFFKFYPLIDAMDVTSSFSIINSLWLAEISRLVYKDNCSDSAEKPTRDSILTSVHLTEVEFLDTEGTQCSIIESAESASISYTVIAFRGTTSLRDWLFNLNSTRIPWLNDTYKVHKGFVEALLNVWPDIDKYLASNSHRPVFFTGHSLGAALAILAASLYTPFALYTYGSPRIGNLDFSLALKSTNAYRIVNNIDIVPTVPPQYLGFHHVGRLKTIIYNPTQTKSIRKWSDPPPRFSDHSPINYVAGLFNLLQNQAPFKLR